MLVSEPKLPFQPHALPVCRRRELSGRLDKPAGISRPCISQCERVVCSVAELAIIAILGERSASRDNVVKRSSVDADLKRPPSHPVSELKLWRNVTDEAAELTATGGDTSSGAAGKTCIRRKC